ncbi:MAG: type II toxin-antitoxin system VapB family antitoxin [Rubrivivax sp.]|nr:type II toxin-antitoxin system VapB family antitoxin [Rubrivivax sp.]
MRTNIVIDDKLMTDTLRATGLKTKREAVELGLRTLLRLGQQEKVRKLRGKISWQGDLQAMRTRQGVEAPPEATGSGVLQGPRRSPVL